MNARNWILTFCTIALVAAACLASGGNKWDGIDDEELIELLHVVHHPTYPNADLLRYTGGYVVIDLHGDGVDVNDALLVEVAPGDFEGDGFIVTGLDNDCGQWEDFSGLGTWWDWEVGDDGMGMRYIILLF